MLFENLTVRRLIIHEVHRRLDDRQALVPTYGSHLLRLSDDAMSVFKERVIAAMGSQSQSMEMTISRFDAESAVELANHLSIADDATFIERSKRFADKLTTAQVSRSLPGGVVVVFDGKAGSPARTIVGVIKAETHTGFRRTPTLDVQYLKDLFMTPQTKLYKIGVFTYDDGARTRAMPEGWTATVYDSQMSSGNRDGAALYFYDAFLGCTLPVNAALLTRQFYENTREFIGKIDIPEEVRSDLITGLYSYLKVDQAPVIEVGSFANQYLPPSARDDFAAFMAQRKFPTNAVHKDLSEIANKLRRRRITFSQNIQLIGPPESFRDLVAMEAIKGEGPDGEGQDWTRITIRDRIRDQE